jgi:RHS repeat-associated protein
VSVRQRAAGRAHYNYFRDFDPAIGRYVEADPLGVKMGNSLYPYVRANPERMVDPLGLGEYDWLDDFRACMRWGGGNCGAVAFASAVAEDFKPIQRLCESLNQGLTCTAHCTGEEFFGTIGNFATAVGKETLLKSLEHVAETTATLWVKRGVPIIAIGFYAYDVYKIAKCTTNCLKE